MSMLDQFQILDDLIFRLTKPPVRTELRNQLALTREQVEAYQASSDKQDETLARQAEAIGRSESEHAEAVASLKKRHRKVVVGLKKQNADLTAKLALYDSESGSSYYTMQP